MEQPKPPSIELAEQNVETNRDYVDVMLGYWTRRKDALLTSLERADSELTRFSGMLDVKLDVKVEEV